MDLITLAICNKKIAGVLAGIDRIEVDDVNRRLIFYFPNGTSATMNFPIPRDGASIVEIKINEEGKMVCRMSDNRVVVSDDPIQTANAAIETLTKKVKYAYWIAGGTAGLAIIELILLLIKVI